MRAVAVGKASALAILLLTSTAFAQEAIAPLPAEPKLERITPMDPAAEASSILTTHEVKPLPAPTPPTPAPAAAAPAELPWKASPPPAAKPAPPPFGKVQPAPAAAKANAYLPAKVPFGRASYSTKEEVPTGPRTTVAVPVSGVDAVEVSEPAPPTPVDPAADPVQEDPATPTELTSPIFDGLEDDGSPRKIAFRVLNKVTAQSALFKAKPGEVVKFGQLEVNPIMCRTSVPTSQTDYAGLLDIREKQPGKEGQIKPIFRGWMYASSPSIAAIEHPIYDVTMVSCDLVKAEPKEEKKEEKKPDPKLEKKAEKKPEKKAEKKAAPLKRR